MYRVPLAQIFNSKPDSEAYAFLELYPKMVSWWITRSPQFRGGPANSFRNQFYQSWKTDWTGYNSQHAQTSSSVAYSILQLNKEPTEKIEPINLKLNVAVVSPRLARIEDGELVFSTRRSRRAHIKLVTDDSRQQILLEQAANGHWQIGQPIVTATWTIMPFTKQINLAEENDRLIKELLSAKL
jgi:hypothetical protein